MSNGRFDAIASNNVCELGGEFEFSSFGTKVQLWLSAQAARTSFAEDGDGGPTNGALARDMLSGV
jgi:hypothetical protein